MDFKELVVSAWQQTLKHIGPVLLVTFVQMVLIIISIGILAPVTTAGYVQSLLRAMREDRPPEVKDLFSEMRLFLPLLLFFFIAAVIIAIGFSLLFLPGFAAAGFIAFASFYLLPLMTDKGFGLIEGVKESWRLAMIPPISDHLVVAIIYVAIMSLGGSLPFAFLITQPLATFIMVGAYQQRITLIEDHHQRSPAATTDSSTPPVPPAQQPFDADQPKQP